MTAASRGGEWVERGAQLLLGDDEFLTTTAELRSSIECSQHIMQHSSTLFRGRIYNSDIPNFRLKTQQRLRMVGDRAC